MLRDDTVHIAMRVRESIDRQEWTDSSDWYTDGDSDAQVRISYLGTYMFLDPCGRYHHFLSPNGMTRRCEQFWESLEKQLGKRGLSLESGEGDPCDLYAVEYRATLIDVLDLPVVEHDTPGPSTYPEYLDEAEAARRGFPVGEYA